jgi:hypothetical protein
MDTQTLVIMRPPKVINKYSDTLSLPISQSETLHVVAPPCQSVL